MDGYSWCSRHDQWYPDTQMMGSCCARVIMERRRAEEEAYRRQEGPRNPEPAVDRDRIDYKFPEVYERRERS